jgi:hypothetical protein
MADPRFRVRQHTLYLPTKEDLDRWKGLAHTRTLTLNQWIYEMVEKALDDTPKAPTGGDDINALRKEVNILRAEVKLLEKNQRKVAEARLEEANQRDLPLDLNVVTLLRRGGSWSAPNLAKELAAKNREQAEAIYRTIEELESLELVKKDWRGWTWKE